MLGHGFSLPPIVLAPVLLLHLPPAREPTSPTVSPAPLQVGCRHLITMATKLGCFLWAWGSVGNGKADHLCHTCVLMSSRVAGHAICGSRHVYACGGGIVCVLQRGSELLWVCLCAWGTGIVYLCEHGATGHRCACLCARVVRGWLQAQAHGFHVHKAWAICGKSWLPHAALETQLPVQVPALCLTCWVT